LKLIAKVQIIIKPRDAKSRVKIYLFYVDRSFSFNIHEFSPEEGLGVARTAIECTPSPLPRRERGLRGEGVIVQAADGGTQCVVCYFVSAKIAFENKVKLDGSGKSA
jgi:hypothetical protein